MSAVSSQAKANQRERNRLYRLAHKDEMAEYKRLWVERNREYVAAEQRARYQAHAEELKEKQRQYRKDNAASVAASNRAWRAAHPELAREISRRNHNRSLEAHAERERLRRSLKRQGGMRIAVHLLRGRWEYFGGKCWMCQGEACEWDHVKPLSRGGLHILSNLRPACRRCNAVKGAQWPVAA